jgi:hypothetical protein
MAAPNNQTTTTTEFPEFQKNQQQKKSALHCPPHTSKQNGTTHALPFQPIVEFFRGPNGDQFAQIFTPVRFDFAIITNAETIVVTDKDFLAWFFKHDLVVPWFTTVSTVVAAISSIATPCIGRLTRATPSRSLFRFGQIFGITTTIASIGGVTHVGGQGIGGGIVGFGVVVVKFWVVKNRKNKKNKKNKKNNTVKHQSLR